MLNSDFAILQLSEMETERIQTLGIRSLDELAGIIWQSLGTSIQALGGDLVERVLEVRPTPPAVWGRHFLDGKLPSPEEFLEHGPADRG